MTKTNAEAEARKKLDRAEREIDREPDDTDATIDVPAGALPHRGVPIDVPDTQEALYSEDGAYRVDEVDEPDPGKRSIPGLGDEEVEQEGMHIIDADEL